MFCGLPGYKPVYAEKRNQQPEDQPGIIAEISIWGKHLLYLVT